MFKLNAGLFVKSFGFNFLNLSKSKLRVLHQLAFLKCIGIAWFEVRVWGMHMHRRRQAGFWLFFDANKSCPTWRAFFAEGTWQLPSSGHALVDLKHGGIDFLQKSARLTVEQSTKSVACQGITQVKFIHSTGGGYIK